MPKYYAYQDLLIIENQWFWCLQTFSEDIEGGGAEGTQWFF